MNKMNKDDVRKQAMKIFRRTRKEIDPMVLLRTKQIIEKNSKGNVFDAFMKKDAAGHIATDTGDTEDTDRKAVDSAQDISSAKADIPVDRTKMCKIVMEYLALRPKQDGISAALNSVLDTANKGSE